MKNAVFYTLGCKLNQCESEALAEAFLEEGYHVSPLNLPLKGSPPDICIINTCTVTSKSEQKARRIIRKISREMKETPLLITGCYAQLNGPELRNLGIDCIIIPQEKKHLLLSLPRYLGKISSYNSSPSAVLEHLRWAMAETEAAKSGKGGLFDYNPEHYPFHARPFLKIQDGCDNRCAYCRVPLARGNSVSLSLPRLIKRVQDLENAGASEVVLTGVNISSYRWEEVAFPEMLNTLLEETNTIRFRLSSLEPENCNSDLYKIAGYPRVRPHFHLPIQSGSDRVLIKMGRKYRRADIYKIVDMLRKSGRDPFIGADFILGFPGESEEDFRLSLSLAEELSLSGIHQFSFSPRPGTSALEMDGKVPERTITERKERLKVLSKTLRAAYIERNLKREVEAIIEIPSVSALTENYLHVRLSGSRERDGRSEEAVLQKGERIRCRIISSGIPPLAEIVQE